jgi:hypothetical protein
MKKSINPMAVLLSVAIAVLIATEVAVNAGAAEKSAKQKQNAQEEFPFDKVGTVTKHGVDTCMEAHILYELNSADHKTKDWLSTSSKTDEALLDKASKDGGWVRVKGTMMVGVEANCKWVKVSSVMPVKKSSQNKR